MVSAIAAYLLAWAGLLLYVMKLGAQQRRLARSVETLRNQIRPPEASARGPSHVPFSSKGVLT